MARRVLLVRGGELPRQSGLGRAHHELVDRLEAGQIPGYELAGVIEHPTVEIHYSAGGADARVTLRK